MGVAQSRPPEKRHFSRVLTSWGLVNKGYPTERAPPGALSASVSGLFTGVPKPEASNPFWDLSVASRSRSPKQDIGAVALSWTQTGGVVRKAKAARWIVDGRGRGKALD